MTYIKIGENYADADFDLLKDFLDLIDTKLTALDKKYKAEKNECLLDEAEYYAGFGFIAIQRYFHSTYPQITISKDRALEVCPNELMSTLNAGANFAKHSEEWPSNKALNKRQQTTLDTFAGEDDLNYYPCANKLFSLTQSLSFTNLLPKIEEWRDALDKSAF